ncbi:MAG: 50S ribosome-binding GTPase, partial [Candidatus Omnitrophica bacterium]|nr:50S ribosome-binding GTPase [Candidatus Omnitrophota bacterium]
MKVVLVGNPNVGKSVIFSSLTGKYVTVSNYPGTTVEIARGIGKFGNKKFQVIDTPGINSLVVHSEDERVTRDILSSGDIFCIIQVADSKNLKRSLLLTLELAELKLPLVLNLNMSDEAKERGIRINTKKLAEKLGIEVVETVAITKEGIPRLRESVLKARVPSLKINSSEDEPIILLERRREIIDDLLGDVLEIKEVLRKDFAELLGKFTSQPLSGVPILIFILWLMYLFVGEFSAGKLVDFFQDTVFGRYINPLFTNFVHRYIPFPFFQELFVGEYGIITMALTYAFAIIFPIVTAFFIFFGVLEDSGYLPRLTVLSDRIFKFIGLNGRAILPLVLG